MKSKFRHRVVLPLLAFLIFAGQLCASHMAGSDFKWTCDPSNPCRITFTQTFYRDCAGVAAVAPSLSFASAMPGCTITPTLISNWTTSGPVEITPLCLGQFSNCSNGTIPGVQRYIYTAIYNFCNTAGQSCTSYNVTWSNCCRNAIITSLTTPETNSITTTFKIPINPNSCNSSPVFASSPILYVCDGQVNTFSQNASDPDGDALRYSLIACMNSPSNPVSYKPGYSATSPLGTTWAVSLDQNNGKLTITPTPGGPLVAVVCIRVEERNAAGVVIGTVVRDMQVRVLNCNNNLPSLSGPFTYSGCVGQQVCMNITSADLNTANNLSVTVVSNNTTGVVVTSPGSRPNASLCFTPTAAGTYTVVLEVKDNACPINGIQQFTYSFNIVNCCNGLTASFYAAANVSPPCSYTFWNNSSPAPSLLSWNFGDGSPTAYGNTVTHVFPNGTWTITMTALWNISTNPPVTCTKNYAVTWFMPCDPPCTNCRTNTVTVNYDSGEAEYRVTLTDEFLENPLVKLTIFDLGGRIIFSSTIEKLIHQPLALPSLAKGIYLARFENGDKMETTKFIVR